MTKLWLCEKPKQGKIVAESLSIMKRHEGYIETKQGIVTWCVGHLVGFKNPTDYSDKWKTWVLDSLPIVPENFDKVALKGKDKQLKIIGKLLKNTNHLILATDGDREGELLGREVLDYFNWTGKIERMWNTSLDTESIENALNDIRPGEATENLYIAGKARGEADYINGMSMTRAATTAYGNGSGVYSVGRIQTAVLGMIVKRGQEINKFVSRDYYELVSLHTKDDKEFKLRHSPKPENRFFDESSANELLESIKYKTVNLNVELKRKKTSPPKLFSLLTLQKMANTAFGWAASKTKEVAQALYDEKITSYPRTNCEYLPNEQEKDARIILDNLSVLSDYASFIDNLGDDLIYRKSVFNTEKIKKTNESHHAIIPTKERASIGDLTADQKLLYAMICKRYIASFMPDYEYDSTIVKYTVKDCEFKGVGNTPMITGWKEIYQEDSKNSESEDQGNQVFPDLENGETLSLDNIFLQTLKTKPPARFNQGSLLDAMEDITSLIEDDKIREDFKNRFKGQVEAGLAAAATRDTYIDILQKREYVSVDKNKIYATELGVKLVEALPNKQSDPVEAALMETILQDISQGKGDKEKFIDTVIKYTTEYVDEIKENAKTFVKEVQKNPCPKCETGQMIRRKGSSGFFWGCNNYPACEHSMQDKKGKPVEQVKATISDVCCELCGKPMAFRNPGKSAFWGCTGYPDCNATLPDDNGKPGKKPTIDESAEECPTCKKGKLVERITKKGKNKGKKFLACTVYACNHFDWIV